MDSQNKEDPIKIEPPRASVPGTRYVSELPDPPHRPADAHKGTFGSVLIIAGSEGMSGASCLAGQAALHGGAGLVTVAIPRCISRIVAIGHVSYMTLPLDDQDGRLANGAVSAIVKALEKQTAAAMGPGLGLSAEVKGVVQDVYANCEVPLVVDADGLNAFTGQVDKLNVRPVDAPRILTPHPGEFSRLTGLDVTTIQSNRSQHAVDFAKKHNVILLLKGPHTVITDGKRLAINSTGNGGMASGGSGDVLTGLIASLLAQGLDAFDGAQLGAHLHGLAGDAMSAHFTQQYATSSELLSHLDGAWRGFAQSRIG